jgi:hypothetical protein
METKMAIPRVPLAGDVIPMRREAHWRADVEVKCVQTVLRPLHPHQETLAWVLDALEPLLDQDLVPVLVQLA